MTALPRTGSFAMVDPTHVAAVGPAAALLYSRIEWRADAEGGEWRAARRELAAETGLSDGMLRGAIQLLREREWITTRRTSPDDATLIWAPLCGSDQQIANLAPPPSRIRTTPPTESAISSTQTEKTVRDTPLPPVTVDGELPLLTVVPDPVEAPVDEVAVEFAAFWQHYPRHVGKVKALQAFRRARKTTPLVDIAQGLLQQLQDLRARETSYVPHPTTWLNQRRWEDEPQHAAAAPTRRGDPFSDPGIVARAEARLASWRQPAALGGDR